MMRIGFQMCPLAEAKPGYDNTLLLIDEALRRGFEAYHYLPEAINLDQTGAITARAGRVNADYSTQPDEIIDLATLDIIFFRQDPPFDMGYITNTYLLERLEGKVRLINHPRWIRDMPDKISIFDYPEYLPPTLITRDPQQIEDFFASHNNDVVVKPLYGFKGHGIERLSSPKDIAPMLEGHNEPLMLQPFLKEIKDGNKRIVLLNGEIIGALKTMPNNDFRIYRDSVDVAYEPTQHEINLCQKLAPTLKDRGLFFVGIDLIGDYLTEINIGSVGSLVRLNEIYGEPFETKLFDMLI